MTDTQTAAELDGDQERMLDKIQKLLRKAESTTPEEAEALFEKAQQLMARWAIDEAMLARAGGDEKPDEIIEHRMVIGGIYHQAFWQLASIVGQNNHLRILKGRPATWSNEKGSVIYWVGYSRDVNRAEMLFASLQLQATSALKTWYADWKVEHSFLPSMEQFKARRTFIFGFADGAGSIMTRAARHARDAVKAESTDSGTGMELALRDKATSVNDWIDRRYGRLRASRSRGVDSGGGGSYGSGRSAGQRADVGNPGVGGSRKAIGR